MHGFESCIFESWKCVETPNFLKSSEICDHFLFVLFDYNFKCSDIEILILNRLVPVFLEIGTTV